VIVVRAGWTMAYNIALRLINRILGKRGSLPVAPAKRAVIVAWCGMRGTVTLAAALALPDGTGGAAAFPYRGLIVLTAFTVVLGTLVIQGFTLRPLLLLLGLGDDGLVERELRAGRAAMFKAALESLGDRQIEVAEALRREYSDFLARADGSDGLFPEAHETETALRANARAAARDTLMRLRASGEVGDTAFQQLEAELDMVELGADVRSRW
jgi:CPA1 family monovalent cation:H+ antiporter